MNPLGKGPTVTSWCREVDVPVDGDGAVDVAGDVAGDVDVAGAVRLRGPGAGVRVGA